MSRRRRRLTGHSGTTLVELLVVVSLLTVVLGLVADTLINAIDGWGRASARLQNAGQLRTAFATMTKEVREAVKGPTGSAFLPKLLPGNVTDTIGGKPVVESGVECYFYANVDNALTAGPIPSPSPFGTLQAPQVIHLYVNASNQLVEQRMRADNPAAASPTYTGSYYLTRILAYNVVVPTGSQTPIFSFYDNNGALLNSGSATAALPDGSTVYDVGILLTVKTNASKLGVATTFTDRVRVTNAYLG